MEKMSKNKFGWLGVLFVLAMLGGMLYAFFGGGYGVLISCEQKEILTLKRVPPPQMTAIGGNTKCFVDLEVKLGDKIICSQNKFKVDDEQLVIPCDGIKDYRNNGQINITTKFYSPNETESGQDSELGNKFW